MSELLQESGEKDRLKEWLRSSLESSGWCDSVRRQCEQTVLANSTSTTFTAKEISASVYDKANGTPRSLVLIATWCLFANASKQQANALKCICLLFV